MGSTRKREFECQVVNEQVWIRLRKRRTAGLQSPRVYFVECDQSECQHVDSNEPPCPLNRSLFEEEIQAREESARLRSDEQD